ncbi:MAG TPA: TonB-dependent receptor [Kofleriaceae bacterium]
MRARLAVVFVIALAGTSAAQPAGSDGSAGSAGSAAATGSAAETGSGSAASLALPTIATTGRVIDKLGKPVRGATVTVEGTDVHTTTNRFGRFSIKAPFQSELTIEKSGFELQLAIVSGESLDDVVLLGSADLSETIEVKADAPVPTAGAAELDREELQRVPGTGGDVVRTLTVMPGVVNLQLPIGYSGVVIRGSSPQDSQILVDDFEIPVLFHNIAFRAILPAESIQTLDYIPGGFDVAYGRASSGIVALTTREGTEHRSEQAEVSVIDGGVLAQGKVGDDTNYMIGFRRSTIDLILPYVIPSSVDLSLTTVPSYYDGQFRIDHRLSQNWRLTLSDVGTIDVFQLYTSKDTSSTTNRFYNRTAFDRLTGRATYHDGPWTATLALSAILPQFNFDLGAVQHIDVTQPAITPRAEVIRTVDELGGLKNVELRAGGELVLQKSYVNVALPDPMVEGEASQGYNPMDTSTSFKGNFWQPDPAQWLSFAANIDPRIRFQAGLRLDEFMRNHDTEIQPRGKLEITLAPKWTLRLIAGAYRRPPEYQTESLYANLQAEHSTQTIAGLEYKPAEGTHVQVSTYYTDRSDLITYDANMVLGNWGRGTTYGAELLGTYHVGPWFAWLSYAYSHSTRVDYPNAPERLFTYDQPHSLNAAASWQHGKWTLGGRFQLYSGLPYTPITGGILNSDSNTYIPINGVVNSARAPIHHELDLRIDYATHPGPIQLTYFIDVQNVYLDQSVVTYFYSYDYTQQAAFKSIPIIPSIGVRGVL